MMSKRDFGVRSPLEMKTNVGIGLPEKTNVDMEILDGIMKNLY